MLAVAARAGCDPRIRGADADAAKTLLREITMLPSLPAFGDRLSKPTFAQAVVESI